jgi:hypothetical protein
MSEEKIYWNQSWKQFNQRIDIYTKMFFELERNVLDGPIVKSLSKYGRKKSLEVGAEAVRIHLFSGKKD